MKIFMPLTCFLLIGFGVSAEHIIGVPPDLVKYEITSDAKRGSLQIMGTLTPPVLVVNGQQINTTPTEKKTTQGLFINNNKVKTKGLQGRFYKEIPINSGTQTLILAGKLSAQKAILNSSPFFFEKPFRQTLFYKKKSKANWSLEGPLPAHNSVYIRGQLIKPTQKQTIALPISLKPGKHSLNLKIKNKNQRRTAYIPYTVKKTEGANDKLFLTVKSEKNELYENFWDIPYHGLHLKLFSTPESKVTIHNQSVTTNSDGQASLHLKFNCQSLLPKEIVVSLQKGKQNYSLKKRVLSSGCQKFKKKNKSRFYFGIAAGHVGFVFPEAGARRPLYSRHISPGPRTALGLRLYDKLYFEARGFKTQSFHNKEGDYLKSLGGGSFWLGYPYRGKIFAAIGVLNYTASSYQSANSNTVGFSNTRSTGIGLELGYRWFVSPSWVLNARISYTHKELSFQSQPERQWPFLILEPIAMEFHF